MLVSIRISKTTFISSTFVLLFALIPRVVHAHFNKDTLQEKIKAACAEVEMMKTEPTSVALEQKAIELHLLGKILITPYYEELNKTIYKDLQLFFKSPSQSKNHPLSQDYWGKLKKEYFQEYIPFAIEQTKLCHYLVRTKNYSDQTSIEAMLQSFFPGLELISYFEEFGTIKQFIQEAFVQSVAQFTTPSSVSSTSSSSSSPPVPSHYDSPWFFGQPFPTFFGELNRKVKALSWGLQSKKTSQQDSILLLETKLMYKTPFITSLVKALKQETDEIVKADAEILKYSGESAKHLQTAKIAHKERIKKDSKQEDSSLHKSDTSVSLKKVKLLKSNLKLFQERKEGHSQSARKYREMIEKEVAEQKNFTSQIRDLKKELETSQAQLNLISKLHEQTDKIMEQAFNLSMDWDQTTLALPYLAEKHLYYQSTQETLVEDIARIRAELKSNLQAWEPHWKKIHTQVQALIPLLQMTSKTDFEELKPELASAASWTTQHQLFLGKASEITASVTSLLATWEEYSVQRLFNEFQTQPDGTLFWLNKSNISDFFMERLFGKTSGAEKKKIQELMNGIGVEASDDYPAQELHQKTSKFRVLISKKGNKAFEKLDSIQVKKFNDLIESLANTGTRVFQGTQPKLKGKIISTFFGKKTINEAFYHQHITESPICVVWIKSIDSYDDNTETADSKASQQNKVQFVIHDITFDHQY